MEEQKVCPHCGQNVEKGEKFCANCGKPLNTAPHPVQQTLADKPKMSHKKRNILIGVAAALFVFFIIGSSGEDEPEPVVQTAEADTPAAEPEEKTSYTPLEVYTYLADNEQVPYILNEKASAFISSHADLFPAPSRDSISDEMIDYSLETKHIQKNESKYGDKMMSLSYLTVVQVWEESVTDEQTLTTLNVIDDAGQQYYIFYLGELANVFEDTVIDVIGLPLGNSSFGNVDGGETLVIVLAGSSVQMVQ